MWVKQLRHVNDRRDHPAEQFDEDLRGGHVKRGHHAVLQSAGMPLPMVQPWGRGSKVEDPAHYVAMENGDDGHIADVHGQHLGGGEVRDGEGGEDVHDAGGKGQLSEWSYPSSNLQEIPRPMLQGGCSQEDFNLFRKEWLRYVRYYDAMVDANEISEQLWNCLDTALQKVVSRAVEVDDFGINVDTITQDKLLMVIKVLAVEVKAVFKDYGGKNDTFTLADVISLIPVCSPQNLRSAPHRH